MSEKPISYVIGFGFRSFYLLNKIDPHNHYLEYFFGLGAIGLFLLLALYFLVIYRVARAIAIGSASARPLFVGSLLSFLCILLAGFFSSPTSNLWSFVWAYIGAILRISCKGPADTSQEKITRKDRDGIPAGGGMRRHA
jgi:O-antigen ligase